MSKNYSKLWDFPKIEKEQIEYMKSFSDKEIKEALNSPTIKTSLAKHQITNGLDVVFNFINEVRIKEVLKRNIKVPAFILEQYNLQ